MDQLLWERVLAAFLVDGSLSVLSGLWLASLWAVGGYGWRGAFGVFSGVLLVGSCAQLTLLTMSFSDQSSIHALMTMMPDVCGTHAGEMLVALCVMALVLCCASWIGAGRLRNAVWGVLLAGCIGLHGSTGHAAADGVVSLAEGLQWMHLFGMAVWSGGVLVSGWIVVPRLMIGAVDSVGLRIARRYLGRLSLASTWAVGVVLASGVVKGYRATDGHVALLRTSNWGELLVVKSIFVTGVVLLGARNHWLLRREWDVDTMKSLARTLRVEAAGMVGVLLLSAWLANVVPPME